MKLTISSIQQIGRLSGFWLTCDQLIVGLIFRLWTCGGQSRSLGIETRLIEVAQTSKQHVNADNSKVQTISHTVR